MITLITFNLFEKLVKNIFKMNFTYLFKSLHLISVISWMAGLLYLPRIFVYHSEADHDLTKKLFLKLWKENFIII